MESKTTDRRFGSKPRRPCEYPGCKRDNIGGYQALCRPHWNERKQAGLPTLYHSDKPQFNGRYVNSVTGYILLRDKEHPLSNKQGYVYEHRAVAYEKYGAGTQCCHWCKAAIEWKDVDVDHVDWNRTNNTPGNLVTSCRGCNAQRSEPKTDEQAKADAERSEKAEKLRKLMRRLND